MLRKDVKKGLPTAIGTADPIEIARFNALADEWWNPQGAFKVIHAFNRMRVAHISRRLPVLLRRDPNMEQPLTGLKIIDVGCGAGLVTEPISRLGGDVVGIDGAERNVRIAERHAQLSGAKVHYRHALPEDCADQLGSFDVVLSLEVVEHVADLSGFLQAIARLAAPGGLVVIGTLNRTVRSYLTAIIAAEYVLGWLPRGTHDWQRFVTPQELASLLKRHGFEIAESCGVVLDPLTMRWRISSDVSTNYLQVHRRLEPATATRHGEPAERLGATDPECAGRHG
jgi:2-polyprenyl-6-hydroxyphenyl methylase / 3-demethylubiquinone-9 3-methyltransferase